MPGWAALSTELKELEMGGDGERELGRWRSFGWWSFGSRQIAARWKLASCCPFARVAWQSSTSVTLKDGKNGSLVRQGCRWGLDSPHSWGGRPLQRPDVLPDSSPDLAVHVTNSGTTLAPRSACPGLKRPIAGHCMNGGIRTYRLYRTWPPTTQPFPLLTPALHVPSLHASINPWAWLL